MPMFLPVIQHLNRKFDEDNIQAFARHAHQFSPGNRLNVEVLQFPHPSLARRFQGYLDNLPGGLQEVLRSLFSYALSASPPVTMNFSWAPGVDYEMTIWEPACGILVQFRSPTPRAEHE